jgi:acetolactate synthase-1/2/3 large subunit
LKSDGPVLCEVMMDPNQEQIPKAINRRLEDGTIKQTAIEDSYPFLPEEELRENLTA